MATTGSNIVSQHYSDFEKKLTIYFLGGGKYEYENIDYPIYEGLINAKNKSEFYNQHIKNKYKYTKIY